MMQIIVHVNSRGKAKKFAAYAFFHKRAETSEELTSVCIGEEVRSTSSITLVSSPSLAAILLLNKVPSMAFSLHF
jgi:hypothetical protein